MGGVLAIDYGAKKSGFATTDALRISRTPLDPVRIPGTSRELLDHVAALVEERPVAVLLVGLPLGPGDELGHEGERARASRDFAARLAARFPDLEVVLHDEHGTTKEAESRLFEAGFRGAEIQGRKDSWSALVLLEDWVRSGEPRRDPPASPDDPGHGRPGAPRPTEG